MKSVGSGSQSAISGFVRAAWPIAVLLALLVLPLAGLSPNGIRLLFDTLVWVTAGVAWNLLGGFAGQVSFGFAVFYGIGAYATALSLNGGLHPFLSFLLGGSAAFVVSLLIGLPTFRLKGPYFAIATIGVSEAVRVVMTNLSFTGGASGYRIVERGAFHQIRHFYTALALAAIAVALSVLIEKSKFGLGLVAIREDEEAASDLGVNPFPFKLAAHAIAAALTGAAGGVYARYAAFIHPHGVFAFGTGVVILLIPIIGGMGTIWGPVVGGIVYGLVHEELIASFPQLHLLLYGSLLILVILFEPGGILGLLGRLLRVIQKARSDGGSRS